MGVDDFEYLMVEDLKVRIVSEDEKQRRHIQRDSDQVAIKLAVNLKLFCNNDL